MAVSLISPARYVQGRGAMKDLGSYTAKLGKKALHEELTNGGTLKIPDWVIDTIFFLIRFVAPTAIIVIMIFQYVS